MVRVHQAASRTAFLLTFLNLDDLPLWGHVGRMSSDSSTDPERDSTPTEYIYTHKMFTIGYNDDRVSHIYKSIRNFGAYCLLIALQIIEINLTDANPVRLDSSSPTVELDFTYSVEWVPLEKEFKDRFDRFLDADFFEHKVG